MKSEVETKEAEMSRCIEKVSLHLCISPSCLCTKRQDGNITCMQMNSLLTGAQSSLTKLICVLLMSASAQCNKNYMGYERVRQTPEGLIQLVFLQNTILRKLTSPVKCTSQAHLGAKPVVCTGSDSPCICSLWCEKFHFYILMSFNGLLLAVSEYSKSYLIT